MQIEADYENIQRDSERDSRNYQQRIAKLESQIDIAVKDRDYIIEQLDNERISAARYKEDYERVQREYLEHQKICERYAEQLIDKDRTIEDLNKRINLLESELVALKSNLKQATLQRDAAEQRAAAATEKLQEAENQISLLEKDNEVLKKTVNDLERDNSIMSHRLGDLEKELVKSRSKMKELEDELRDAKGSINALEADLNSARNTIKDRDSMIEKLRISLENITEQFHIVQKQFGEMETAYEFSEQEKDDLKAQLSAAERQTSELR